MNLVTASGIITNIILTHIDFAVQVLEKNKACRDVAISMKISNCKEKKTNHVCG